MTLALLESWHN